MLFLKRAFARELISCLGKITEGRTKPSFIRLFIAALVEVIAIYAIGVPYLYLIITNVIGKKSHLLLCLKLAF